jgi:hypothetical protein
MTNPYDHDLERIMREVTDQLPEATLVEAEVVVEAEKAFARNTTAAKRKRFAVIAASAAVAASVVGLVVLAQDNSTDVEFVPASSVPTTLPNVTTSIVTGTSVPTTTLPATATQYVATARDGDDFVVSVVDATSGNVVREVLRSPGFDPSGFVDGYRESTFRAETLAPDGTVYLIQNKIDANSFDANGEGQYEPFASDLIAIAPDGAQRIVRPYVTAFLPTPDWSALIVTVESPDGDGDGKGTQALRRLDLVTGDEQTIASTTFDIIDGRRGDEGAYVRAQGWTADGSRLVLHESCCDTGQVALVDLNAAGLSWSTLFDSQLAFGDSWTDAIGLAPDGRIYVNLATFREDESNGRAMTGREIVAVNPDTGASEQVRFDSIDIGELPPVVVIGRDLPGTPFAGICYSGQSLGAYTGPGTLVRSCR